MSLLHSWQQPGRGVCVYMGALRNYAKIGFDLLAPAQLLWTVTDEVKVALCDQTPSPVLEAAEIADESRAHGGQKPQGKGNPLVPQVKKKEGSRNKPNPNVLKQPRGSLDFKAPCAKGRQAVCPHRWAPGHIKPNCPKLKATPQSAPTASPPHECQWYHCDPRGNCRGGRRLAS
ncbi:hypothetical protein KIL84_005227 [Mauremys mutica]|uniref:Uncharacterized protein n=1 Tax=Mauremys mutica TaxID=74926 RepID=A0A9D4B5M5_9SAUR|nr:hypothetical protein KIL84_005227 [Mauremys mutica]